MIYAFLTSLEPVVNGEIPEFGIRRPKGAPLSFNRRNVVYPETDGKTVRYRICRIPVINGNSVRGQTRRRFIYKTLQVLETPEKSIHPEIIHFISAGGGTGKDDSPGQEQFKFKQEIRKKLPFVNLLGGALRGMFLKGMLRVGFVYPIIKETCWMLSNTPLKERFQDVELLTASDLEGKLDVIRLTRCKIDDEFLKYSEADELSEDGEVVVEVDDESDDDDVKRDKGAIYSAEALPAGLPMWTYFELCRNDDEILEAALHAFVESFKELSSIGGWKAKGCGHFAMEFMYADGTSYNPQKAEKYWEYLKENKNEINYYMSKELAEYLRSTDKAREEKKKKK